MLFWWHPATRAASAGLIGVVIATFSLLVGIIANLKGREIQYLTPLDQPYTTVLG
ncbi:hypothetical protein [Nocardia seriolae]|uniref:Uncharacterized protein n=1 Tax=Nocardia seriolae TaxID=37332 RepID=A0ABC8ALG6_9NOCA|nr:hypothetical protein [Nocardia seriolae]APA94945.1 hypothetical protein NS506_00870 [Nocardia seriolae]QOW37802.1 hypothetical protein IMZ23_31335 [Nocardia seriolae]WNJ59519.1 hypothetical protein RMO66_01285 [Nocardia seriolae]BEK92325.1 hypothetical protein NSER024013_02310 [Nocardia seriolae]